MGEPGEGEDDEEHGEGGEEIERDDAEDAAAVEFDGGDAAAGFEGFKPEEEAGDHEEEDDGNAAHHVERGDGDLPFAGEEELMGGAGVVEEDGEGEESAEPVEGVETGAGLGGNFAMEEGGGSGDELPDSQEQEHQENDGERLDEGSWHREKRLFFAGFQGRR